MRIQSELCHIGEGKMVVRVIVWDKDTSLGSALGEGPNAEIAEDRAIERFLKRTNTKNSLQNTSGKILRQPDIKPKQNDLDEDPKYFKTKTLELKRTNNRTANINNSPLITNDDSQNKSKTAAPENWSEELAVIENEIARIGWSRTDEDSFLLKHFEVRSRSRITDYTQLLDYLNKLRDINPQNESKEHEEIKRNILLTESDKLITQLNWTKDRSRVFLKTSFQVISRQKLNLGQLQRFNSLLKEELTKATDKSQQELN